MLNNFIYAQTKDLFLNALNAGNILDEAIVFIEDTKEIWNHGHYFAGESIDPNIISEIQSEINTLKSYKLDTNVAETLYAHKTEVESTYATKAEVADLKWMVLTRPIVEFKIKTSLQTNTSYTFQCEEGMTWNELVNSEYNDNRITIVDGEVKFNDQYITLDRNAMAGATNNIVLSTSVIETYTPGSITMDGQGHNYITFTPSSSGGSNTGGLDPIVPPILT